MDFFQKFLDASRIFQKIFDASWIFQKIFGWQLEKNRKIPMVEIDLQNFQNAICKIFRHLQNLKNHICKILKKTSAKLKTVCKIYMKKLLQSAVNLL